MKNNSISRKSDINREAAFLASKFSHLQVLRDSKYTKLILGLYYNQKETEDIDKWTGMTIKELITFTGEKYIESKHKNLHVTLFDKLGSDWVVKKPNMRYPSRHYYILTKDAFNAVEQLVTANAEIFDFFKTPVPLNEFQRFVLRIDSFYYVIRAVTVINFFARKSDEKSTDLLSLASALHLKPSELITILKKYVVLNSKTEISDEKDKYFIINSGTPWLKAYFLKCDDRYLCSLCRRCHRTKITLTMNSMELTDMSIDKTPFITSKTLIRIVNHTAVFIGLLTTIGLLLIWITMREWLNEGLMPLSLILFSAFFIGWFLARRTLFVKDLKER
ncbi:MAG: hypothetical protein ACFFD4_28120 [Candidatus Odinarchaeota archaeon]